MKEDRIMPDVQSDEESVARIERTKATCEGGIMKKKRYTTIEDAVTAMQARGVPLRCPECGSTGDDACQTVVLRVGVAMRFTGEDETGDSESYEYTEEEAAAVNDPIEFIHFFCLDCGIEYGPEAAD